jgi:hypothetical protein
MRFTPFQRVFQQGFRLFQTSVYRAYGLPKHIRRFL